MDNGTTHAEETCSKTVVEGARSRGQPDRELKRRKNDIVELDEATGSPANIQSPNDYDDDESFPEGGYEAWLVVLGSFCALFMVFGLTNSTAVFQEYFMSHQLSGYSSAEIGWIFSLNLFLTFFCGLQSGRVFDAHGPRVLVALGSLALTLSMICLGFCTGTCRPFFYNLDLQSCGWHRHTNASLEFWHFVLDYSVLGGVGGALLMTPAFASVGHFFKRRRGLATGIANTSGSIGGIVIPLMLKSLLPRVGFAWSTRVLGFLFLLLGVPANLFIKSRLPPVKTRLGLIPDMTALKDTRFALCSAGMFVMEWGLFVPLTYISSYVTSHGQDDSFAFTIVALLNAGSFFGRWIPGVLADRWGRFNVIILTILLCVITVFAFWLPAGNSTVLIIVFAITFGFASGSNLGLIPVCLSQLCHVSDYGRYFSTSYFFTSFGTLTSIPIGGQILSSAKGEYWGVIIFAGLSYVAALGCYTASRVVAVGWKPKTFF